ncbi:SurA N-terminal domain-containing protein [Allosphingosinicella flava]|uniref:Parvulin-like PPIase n=1 Tax=Allosphingosinicella flava TaxID=2771430 RepID=A0A7T2GLA9_9SPHN|nr:peptidylprolyl isomerase [Sphingosinicella flava]QPQ55877.1 SurA N-terminal domain-containing protein [Sphingosinicella flava]
MISFLRRGLSSWIVVALLGLIALAFIITGVGTPSGLGNIGGGDTVAEVNGEAITATEVADQVNRQLSRARQQQPELTMAQFLEGDTLERLVDQMITARAIAQFGDEQGLAAPRKLVDTEIASLPAFHNLAGQFDQQTFRRALQAQNITEDQLRKDLAASLIERQLMLPVGAAPRIPEGVALQYASLLLERRSGSVGAISLDAVPPGPAPTAAELNAFYTRNQARYTIPERRVIRYAMFGADQVAAAAQPSDQEIAAFYQANQATYGAKQGRSFSQVVLPDEAAARAFAQKLSGGKSFAQAAQEAGFAAGDTSIGEQTRESLTRLTNAAIANAAFSAAAGTTTQPARSELGWHILRVDSVTNTPARPLASVRAEIATQLRTQKTQEALSALATRIEDAIADGSTFDEAVRAEKLTVAQTVPVTATGQAPGTANYQLPEGVQPLLQPAFELTADDDPVVQAIEANQRYAVIALGDVIPAAPPALAQIQDRVRADFIAKRASDQAKRIADQIAARINGGMAPQAAFAAAGVKVEGPRPVSAQRIEIARQGQQVPPPVALMFSIPKGKARVIPAPDGIGWFVVHLNEVIPGDARGQPQLVAATRQQFGQALGDEYALQFARAAQRSLKVERHDAAIQRLKSQLLGRGAQ